MSSSKTEYYHSLDFLRVIMMLLGILLHGTISYTTLKHGANWPLFISQVSPTTTWPYKDSSHHLVFDYIHNFIHIFRMPLFFVLSGVLAHHTFRNKGAQTFIQSRNRRILYPIILFWPFLFPLVGFGLMPLLPRTREIDFWFIVSVISPMHLWFLFYLLYFYGLIIAFEKGMELRPALRKKVYSINFTKMLPIATGIILFSAGGEVVAASRFLPNLPAFLVYFSFFFYGWLMYLYKNGNPGSKANKLLILSGGITIIFYLTLSAG